MTVSVFADSDSLCALSLPPFAHLLPCFFPVPSLSQLSQQTDVLLLEMELYSTVGVSGSEAQLALMIFSCCFLLPTVIHTIQLLVMWCLLLYSNSYNTRMHLISQIKRSETKEVKTNLQKGMD